MPARPFLISATVDFPDDCQFISYTPDLLAQLFDRLRWMGVRRVYWMYYNAGFWGVFVADREQPGTRESLRNLGHPLAVARQLAHQRGMELYAVIKPYETGFSHATPAGSPEARRGVGLPRIGGNCTSIDPWIVAHPEFRVRARAGDMPRGLERIPVQRIQLRQKDMAPIRIRPENLEIWTSADNYGYQKRDVTFTLTETVETCPKDVIDVRVNLLTRAGEPVRVLNVSGLNLLDPFIAITTNFDDDTGSFRNKQIDMVRAFGPGDLPLPIVTASHKAIWDKPRDLRRGALDYDGGTGEFNVCLDVTNRRPVCVQCRENRFTECGMSPIDLAWSGSLCTDGVIAFAKGRNLYVAGSACEAEPEVQAWWLEWVGECLQAGVDGIDWRIAMHSLTDAPDLYGFNEPVLREYERRYGVNPDREPFDAALLGAIRGDFYDQFLWSVKRRLAAAGKRMQVHLEMDKFMPDAPVGRRRTQPGNITFHWRRWLRGGLADEATLSVFGGLEGSPLAQEALVEAAACDVPVYLSQVMWVSRDGQEHAGWLENAYRHAGLSGYLLYETAAMYDAQRLGPDGRLHFYPGLMEGIRERIQRLGIT